MKNRRERLSLEYVNLSENFLIKSNDIGQDCFQRQFYFFYRGRIAELTERIKKNGLKKMGPTGVLSQLADVTNTGEDYFVIGVVLKKMKYRQSVLYEFADEETLDVEFREKLKSENLVSDGDILEFEDDQQIVKLCGNINPNLFVTGQVIGLIGNQHKDDIFNVKDIILPEYAPQVPWPLMEKDCYVLFLSGLSLGSNIAQNICVISALEKLFNWLCAETCLSEKELDIVLNIDRLIIAGDSIRVSKEDVDNQRMDEAVADQDIDKDAINHFDRILSRIVSTIPVDLMPGLNDPSSILIPQQPIPRMIFSWSKRFGTMLNCVTNPYKFSLNEMHFLGTSGQNITDLSKITSGFSSTLDLMEQCLERSHIFPTVPDSIDGFPFQLRDPLILEDMPHVFFVGNQKSLSYRTFKRDDGAKTLLLTVPEFSKTQNVVLLNLKNLRVTEYEFTLENDLPLI